jgi:hypothetical protein
VFDGWYDGTDKLSGNATYDVTMNADMRFTAKFTPTGGGNTDPDTPGAVGNFTATPRDKQVDLSWEAPTDNGGSAITAYEVTMDNWTTKVTKTASQLSHTYTDLTNGTKYTFKVRAVNTKGTGAEATAEATPTASSNEPLGDWTLPTNLKMTFKQGGADQIVVKVGNDYYGWTNSGNTRPKYTEYYYKYDAAQTRWELYDKHPDVNGGQWRQHPLFPTFTEDELENYLRTIYQNVLTNRDIVKNRPVTGTATVLNRPVEIRTQKVGLDEYHYYVDVEHNLILKNLDGNGENIGLEVTEWDETVTNFSGIDLPE